MILIGLGANLDGPGGSPQNSILMAVDVLRKKGIALLAGSQIWESAPVPVSNQPWYKNAVCSVGTALAPLRLLALLKEIEMEFGRTDSERNAPRVIDLDLLAYGEMVLDGNLMVPHPRMHERAFVLYPLREIADGWVHPVLGKSVDEMIAGLPKGQDLRCMEGVKLC